MYIFKAYRLSDGFPADWDNNTLPVISYSFTRAIGSKDSTLTATIDIETLEYASGLAFSYVLGELIDSNMTIGVFEREPQTGDTAVWYGRIHTAIVDSVAGTLELQASGILSIFEDLQLSTSVTVGTHQQQQPLTSVSSNTKIGILKKLCRIGIVQTLGDGSNIFAFPSEFRPIAEDTGTQYSYSFLNLEMKNAKDAIVSYSDNIGVPPYVFTATVQPDTHLSIDLLEVTASGVYLSENTVNSVGNFTGCNTVSHTAKFINNLIEVNEQQQVLFALQATHPYARGLYAKAVNRDSIITLAAAREALDSEPNASAFSTQIIMNEDIARDRGLEPGELVEYSCIIAGAQRYFYGFVTSLEYSDTRTVTFTLEGLFTSVHIGFDDQQSIATVSRLLESITLSDNSVVNSIKAMKTRIRDNSTTKIVAT